MVYEQNCDLVSLALILLKNLGNPIPTSKEISNMKNLLSNVTIQTSLALDKRLTVQEKHCLYLAAHGKTSLQTAKLLNIGVETVRSHLKNIRRKLSCNTMAHAVYQGIRYGYLCNTAHPPIRG